MKSTRIPNTKTATEMARFTRERAPLSLESLRKTAAGKMKAIGVAVRQPYKNEEEKGCSKQGNGASRSALPSSTHCDKKGAVLSL